MIEYYIRPGNFFQPTCLRLFPKKHYIQLGTKETTYEIKFFLRGNLEIVVVPFYKNKDNSI